MTSEYLDSRGVKTCTFLSWKTLTVLLSPLLNSIDVFEEQQDLPGAALLSLREKQVVAGDTQRPSAGWMQRLSEDNILHVGRLDVLRKLHSPFSGEKKKIKKSKKKKNNSSPQNFCCWLEITPSTLVRKWKQDPSLSRLGTTADALLLQAESVYSPLFFFCTYYGWSWPTPFFSHRWLSTKPPQKTEVHVSSEADMCRTCEGEVLGRWRNAAMCRTNKWPLDGSIGTGINCVWRICVCVAHSQNNKQIFIKLPVSLRKTYLSAII